MPVPVDLEQRQRALRPDQSFIVQAPAGSGKTELLIQRYLRLLASVSAPEEIVALTFTRKAAAEMRGRVTDALEKASTAQVAGTAPALVTAGLAEAVITQDQKQGWQLRDNPARLRIQTIDSLTASLTRQMPILSGFGAQPETIEDASELYRLAAANTLAELESGDGWSAAIAVLVKHLDNDLPRVRDMLASMLARRDQWLRHVGRQQQREELEAAILHLVEAELERARQCVPAVLQAELLELLRYAAENLEAEARDSLIRSCLELENMPPARASALDQWRAIAELLLTRAGEWRKTANANIGFPPASGSRTEGEKRGAMKTRFDALLANLSADPALVTVLKDIGCLPPVNYSEGEWEVVDALYQLLMLADAQLRLLFAERNQMDFTGIALAAIHALGEVDAPSDLALQLDYQLRHILVDEFQDISTNQYVLLERLTAGWSGDDGHSLFLVGDPMQSIYRFREADVGLFLNTWQQARLNQVPLIPLSIRVNFRSDAGIVEWVNRVFEKVLPARPDIGRGAVSFARAEAFHAATVKMPVQLHPVLVRDTEREAALVVQVVKDARRQDPHGSLAILVRNRSHLRDIVMQLRDAGVAYQAVDIEALGQRPAIQDLLALSLAMTHPAERVAWLAILRAPWCGLELADLFQLVGDHKGRSVWDCMQDPECVHRLSEAGQLRLRRLGDILAAAFAQQGRRRLARWVESVWMSLGGPASLDLASDLENSRTFFMLLDEFDEGGDLRDRQGFIDEVAGLYAVADTGSEAAVQIMTMHKAKGLEFDTVILPGLARGSMADESRLLLWMERPHGGQQDLLLAPVREAGTPDSPLYDYLKRLEREKQDFEQGRLLYVAATRAKRHLHIVATAQPAERGDGEGLAPPRRGSLLSHLWPLVKNSFDSALAGQAGQAPADTREVPAHPVQFRRIKPGWQMPAPPAAVNWHGPVLDEPAQPDIGAIEYEWAGESIKHVGTVVHRCIQSMAEEGMAAWDATSIADRHGYYRLFLRRLGVAEEKLEEAAMQVRKALLGLRDDPRGQWLFSPAHREARNEYAISGLYQGKIVNVVLDRTFIDTAGIRWIVDYKTSEHEGGDREAFLDQQRLRYRQQLEKYGRLIKGLEDRPVKLGLYFPLLQGWREWDLP